MANYFPNGTWAGFGDDHFFRIKITGDPGIKKGKLTDVKERSFLLGAYEGKTYDLTGILVLPNRTLKAHYCTSKLRGQVTIKVRDDGIAVVTYNTINQSPNFTRTLKSHSLYSNIDPPPDTQGGMNLKVSIRTGDLAGLKVGASITVGDVYVRDLDLLWENLYRFFASKAGAAGGIAPIPDSTDWHSITLNKPCPNWSGAEVSLYSRGIDAGIVSLGSKVEFGFTLENGEYAYITETSWFKFTWPKAAVDLGSVGVGQLTKIGRGKSYLGR